MMLLFFFPQKGHLPILSEDFYVDLVVEISNTQKYMCMKDEMYLWLHFFLNILAANFRNARNNSV